MALTSVELHLNGSPPTLADLAHLAQVNYGHFTSMQVEDGAVRGLHLHLQRLDRASRLLFGAGLPPEDVRGLLRQALNGRAETFSVRITVFSRKLSLECLNERYVPDVLIRLGAAGKGAAAPLHLHGCHYQREMPAIKHLATLGLLYQRRQAQQSGCDDALFLNSADEVTEASVWNIGFVDHSERIVWPDAPVLNGVAQQLLRRGLRQAGMVYVEEPIPRQRLTEFRAAFLCNSRVAVQPVARIDSQQFVDDPTLWQGLRAAFLSQPLDRI